MNPLFIAFFEAEMSDTLAESSIHILENPNSTRFGDTHFVALKIGEHIVKSHAVSKSRAEEIKRLLAEDLAAAFELHL